jgi:AraC-like DNA-binding protein
MLTFDQFLDGLQIRLKPFAICDIRSGTGLPLEDEVAHIHYVLHGDAQVLRRGHAALSFPVDHVLILPPRTAIRVVCGGSRARFEFPTPVCRAISGGWDWIDVGEGDSGAVLACGRVEATHQGAIGLFDRLKEPLVEDVSQEPSFKDAIRLLLSELAFPKPGTQVLTATLMRQCLIVLLRRYWQDEAGPAPWISSLKEPQLGTAILAMADKPEAPHTLQGLADISGMSRAAFAEHFKRTYRRTPMDYLKTLRLRRAADLLSGSDLPVKVVTGRVGFESRSYFTRAFRAYSGLHPTEYRARARAGTEPDVD